MRILKTLLIILAFQTAAPAWSSLFRQPNEELAYQFIASWPEDSQLAAQRALEKYGPPDELAYNKITWYGPAPMIRTSVHRLSLVPNSEAIVEQEIPYKLPMFSLPFASQRDLIYFNKGVRHNMTEGTLVAASESPEVNLLALNLADEIIYKRRSVKDADNLYEKTLMVYYSGKSSPYMERLLFMPPELHRRDWWRGSL